MMLLTDEEIEKAIGDYIWNSDIPEDDFYYEHQKFANHFMAVAKAQARKILEELEKIQKAQGISKPLYDFIQDLKKEIGEE